MIRVLLMLTAILGLALLTTAVNAKPLTHAQVETTCGNKYGSSSGGHTGCVKECGKGVCMYDCKGKGKKEDCVGIAFMTAHPGGGSDDQPEAYLPPTPGVMLVMDFVSFGALQSACGKIPDALFGKTDDKYACANPKCDKSGGTCMVVCVGHQCQALMPGQPDGSMTLVALLQGGKGVIHGGQLDEGSTTRSGPAPTPTKAPPVIIIP